MAKEAAAQTEEITRVCSSCGSNISGKESFSQFQCPACGNTRLTRCSKCKTIANSYKCESCGFEGP